MAHKIKVARMESRQMGKTEGEAQRLIATLNKEVNGIWQIELNVLLSYGRVCGIAYNGVAVGYNYSQTTMRHLSRWANEEGYSLVTSPKIDDCDDVMTTMIAYTADWPLSYARKIVNNLFGLMAWWS